MRGRPPKPTALRVLQGNPGKRPLPADEPKPEGPAVRPKFLKGRSRKIWDEFAPIVEKMGLLTSADAMPFARWCVLQAEFEKDADRFPASKMARMDSLEARFGLDPSSRARLGTGRKKPRANAFAELTG